MAGSTAVIEFSRDQQKSISYITSGVWQLEAVPVMRRRRGREKQLGAVFSNASCERYPFILVVCEHPYETIWSWVDLTNGKVRLEAAKVIVERGEAYTAEDIVRNGWEVD